MLSEAEVAHLRAEVHAAMVARQYIVARTKLQQLAQGSGARGPRPAPTPPGVYDLEHGFSTADAWRGATLGTHPSGCYFARVRRASGCCYDPEGRMGGESDHGDPELLSAERLSRDVPTSGPGREARWGNLRLFVAGLIGCLGLSLALLLGLAGWSDEGGQGEGPARWGDPPVGVLEGAPLPRGDVVAVLAAFPAPAGLPTLSEVPIVDQGIALHRPVQPNVYLLEQMSTGRYISDQGRLVLVDADGRRLRAGPPTQAD